MTTEVPHPVLSDARDNRARILEAARTVFGEEGLGAPMREVARRAGVGPATLYRHFPAKWDLLAETFAEQRRACRTAVRDALADPDPWHGFRTLIERICELHAHSSGFADAFMTAFPETTDFTADRELTLRAVAEVARRARQTGGLRQDFVVDDLVLILLAHRGLQDTPHQARIAASRRYALRHRGVPRPGGAHAPPAGGTPRGSPHSYDRTVSP